MSAELQRERAEVGRLRDIITRAYVASDNDGGSASDAIQEMLWILDEADRDRTETGEADDGSLAHPDQGLEGDDDCWADYAMRMRAANERALEALRGGSSRSLYDAEVMLSDALGGEGPATEDERKFIERWIAALHARRLAILGDGTPVYDAVADGESPRRHEWSQFRACGLLWLVNTILHVFGWAIVVTDGGEAYPARTCWRGFPEETQHRAHAEIASYLRVASQALVDESEKEPPF